MNRYLSGANPVYRRMCSLGGRNTAAPSSRAAPSRTKNNKLDLCGAITQNIFTGFYRSLWQWDCAILLRCSQRRRRPRNWYVIVFFFFSLSLAVLIWTQHRFAAIVLRAPEKSGYWIFRSWGNFSRSHLLLAYFLVTALRYCVLC